MYCDWWFWYRVGRVQSEVVEILWCKDSVRQEFHKNCPSRNFKCFHCSPELPYKENLIQSLWMLLQYFKQEYEVNFCFRCCLSGVPESWPPGNFWPACGAREKEAAGATQNGDRKHASSITQSFKLCGFGNRTLAVMKRLFSLFTAVGSWHQ